MLKLNCPPFLILSCHPLPGIHCRPIFGSCLKNYAEQFCQYVIAIIPFWENYDFADKIKEFAAKCLQISGYLWRCILRFHV